MVNALIVDDNRSTADSIVSILMALGINAHAAYGPGAGITILNKETPDLVFLDINMPGVSGFEILSFISREPRLGKVSIFICSSDDQPETRKKAEMAGVIDFILKPVSIDALENALVKAGFL